MSKIKPISSMTTPRFAEVATFFRLPVIKNIKDLDLLISDMAMPLANYVPYKIFDKILYVSGQAPSKDGSLIYIGKVGEEITIDKIENPKMIEIGSFNGESTLIFGASMVFDKIEIFTNGGLRNRKWIKKQLT